jgi:hypothetical protein
MSKVTVIKLRGALEPPKPWREAGFEPSRHVYVDEVERLENGDVRARVDHVAAPWRIGRGHVVDVRPPGHPAHPENL